MQKLPLEEAQFPEHLDQSVGVLGNVRIAPQYQVRVSSVRSSGGLLTL